MSRINNQSCSQWRNRRGARCNVNHPAARRRRLLWTGLTAPHPSQEFITRLSRTEWGTLLYWVGDITIHSVERSKFPPDVLMIFLYNTYKFIEVPHQLFSNSLFIFYTSCINLFLLLRKCPLIPNTKYFSHLEAGNNSRSIPRTEIYIFHRIHQSRPRLTNLESRPQILSSQYWIKYQSNQITTFFLNTAHELDNLKHLFIIITSTNQNVN
jgi:hypothetical protein